MELLDLNTALAKLRLLDSRLDELVTVRFSGGLSVQEAAEVLGVSAATVKRAWSRARAWLFRELRGRPVDA